MNHQEIKLNPYWNWNEKINYFFKRERSRINWHIKRAQKLKDDKEEKYWLKVLHYLEIDESKIIL